MYLVITNDIVAPVESFTMLGLSTARGKADKIGQFGSGAKHAICTLLRNGITPIISLGGRSLTFSTVDGQMGEKQYKKVVYRFDGGPQESTSMTLDFGSLDWVDVSMGLREFVSNAIDSCDSVPVIKLCETVTVGPGQTVIAVPCTPDVMKFYSELPERFLQFSSRPNANDRILYKQSAGKGLVYRKGVLVRQAAYDSIYDYNLGEESKIDESRNMSEYTIVEQIAILWRSATVDKLVNFFGQIDSITEKVLEGKLSYFTICPQKMEHKSNWRTAFKQVHGDVCIVPENGKQLAELAIRKGINYLVVPTVLYHPLMESGIQTLSKLLHAHGVDHEGRMLHQPIDDLVRRVTAIWAKLSQKDLVRGMNMPGIMQYTSMMDGGSMTHGYYKNGVIYIAKGHESDCQTILEELAHYITGSTDNSRDFQDYAFLVAASFMMNRRM